MTTEQHPATDLLITRLAETVQQIRGHEHPLRGEDLYCLNLHAWMGERMAAVLTRLAETEAEVQSWKDRHTALTDEASRHQDVIASAVRYYRASGDGDSHNDLMDVVAPLVLDAEEDV
jgi:hypothetical protein